MIQTNARKMDTKEKLSLLKRIQPLLYSNPNNEKPNSNQEKVKVNVSTATAEEIEAVKRCKGCRNHLTKNGTRLSWE